MKHQQIITVVHLIEIKQIRYKQEEEQIEKRLKRRNRVKTNNSPMLLLGQLNDPVRQQNVEINQIKIPQVQIFVHVILITEVNTHSK